MEKKHQNNKKHVTYADEYSDTDDSEDCSEDHKLLSYERKNKNKIKNSKQCLDSLNDQDENKQDTEQEDVPGSFIKQNQLTELSNGTYWLTRIVLLRYMGFIYFVAFMVSLYQNKALIGKTGLLPAQTYLKEISRRSPSFLDQIQSVPTIFWLFDYRKNIDGLLYYTSLSGALLSAWLIITGAANMILMFVLWILYHSIVNVGQRWYSFGWESQALETGFLCIFLCPLLAVRTVPKGTPTSRVFILALLWLIIRIMLGAGLIKIRGDKCWWPDLNCMAYHYETQPVPNPFSYYLHGTPLWFHKFEVLINHFVELIAPFLLIVPIRRVRIFGGIIQIAFQATLIFSGNLSFLNWLTILPSLAVFDDASLSRLFSPSRGSPRWHVRQMQLEQQRVGKLDPTWTQAFRTMFNLGIGAIIAYLSIPIVQNLLSTRQVMNTSFDSFRIVNTYGAFGSITKQRTEIILQGTTSDDPTSFNAEWKEYEFHCKPGNVHRMPCLISPYHYRLDWLMWFAAFQNYQQNPWILHLTAKLLVNDRETLTLINHNPFNKTEPPKFIRAEHYRYSFSKFLSTDYKTGAWWTRSRIGSYFPPVSLESLKDTIVGMGWKMPRVKKTYSHQKPEKTEF